MDFSTIVIWALALALVAIASFQGKETLTLGLRGSWDALLRFLPLLLGIFIIIGFSDILLPKELIAQWLGGESGLKGIFIASGLGAITPGGPFVSYPLVATVYEAGAGIGPVVAFVTAWSLWAVSRLPLELAIVGPRVTAIRLASTLLFPPLAGLFAATVLKSFAR
ncbi:MAG: permease [Candidatus Promineifilaceae bacterium]|nr:permease [Candidatus Promineifilaceae bacterium]